MSSLTFDQIVEAIGALPPQERIRLRQWLNRSAVNEEPNQGSASNGGVRNAPDVDVIPPIVMKRVPPIAPERGIEKEMKWLREHRVEYANQWVALDEDRLVSAGRSAKEVHAAAKAAGVPHALIVLVEPPDMQVAGLTYQTTVYFAEYYGLPRNLLGKFGWLQQIRFGLVDYDEMTYISDYNDPA